MESSINTLTQETFKDLIDLKAKNFENITLQANTTAIIKDLQKSQIDLELIKEISQKGYLVDRSNLRSLCWKIFLKYIDLQSTTWEDMINKKREEYGKIKQIYMSRLNIQIKNKSKNGSNSNANGNNGNNNSKKQKAVDHPLSTTTSSQWNNYFEDFELLKKIDQDLKRTRKDMAFFTSTNQKNSEETNENVLKRILFLYSKEHQHVKYVQGLNEVLAIIYFCLSNDKNSYFAIDVEADTYFCFVELMKQIESMYIEKLDSTENGIEWKLFNVKIQLRHIDIDLFNSLNDKNIDFHFFAFKWFTLLFTQEYSMTDALRLWDWILTFEDKFECLKLLTLSALRLKKKTIIYGDFSSIMDSLQNFNIDVETLIKSVNDVRRDLDRCENK